MIATEAVSHIKRKKDRAEEEKEILDGVDSSDEELESFLFGASKKKTKTENVEEEKLNDNGNEPEPLLSFVISTKPSNDEKADLDEDDKKLETDVSPTIQSLEKKPAWEDPDDDNLSIDIDKKWNLKKLKENHEETSISGRTFQRRLKEKYERVLPAPAWADIDEEDIEDNEEDKLFKTTSNLLDKSSVLQGGILSFTRKRNLNKNLPETSGITSVEFHPTAKIAFTSSLSKRLNIFQADGEMNKKLQSIFLDNFPITSAHFTNSGKKIVLTGNKRYFYIFDLVAGQVTKVPGLRGKKGEDFDKFVVSPDGTQVAFLGDGGFLHFASTESYQYMHSLKMNGSINAATFQSLNKILSTGGDGEVYIWDARMRRCTHRFVDEGSIGSTCIASSNNNKFVAVGSKSGVVNVYEDNTLSSKDPKPIKTIMNLTTEVEGVKFNPSSEILAYYSSSQKNAVKLLHFPSLTTFNNWPHMNDKIGHVSCVDFSPLSGYLGLGTEKGDAPLYRLKHFPDA